MPRRATQSENSKNCRLRLAQKQMKLRAAARGVHESKATEIVIMSVITNEKVRWVGRLGAKNTNGDIQLRNGTYVLLLLRFQKWTPAHE